VTPCGVWGGHESGTGRRLGVEEGFGENEMIRPCKLILTVIIFIFAMLTHNVTRAEAQNTLKAERYGGAIQCWLKRGSMFVPGGCFLNDVLHLDGFMGWTDFKLESIGGVIAYYTALGDVESLVEAEKELDFWRGMSAQLLWARAIRDADSLIPNFDALQQHMNVHNFGSVELRPYTDGTMDIYVDGKWNSRQKIGEVLEEIVALYAPDRNWRASISPNGQDVDWAWDEFRDEFENNVWRCRGEQSGEFLQDVFCVGQPKIDYTWPGD